MATPAGSDPNRATGRKRRARRGAGRENTDKVKKKLDIYFKNGQFYEAQQLYHTLFNRLNARKKFSEAIDLLSVGVNALLDHTQASAAGDLGLKLVELLQNSERKVDDESLALLKGIAAKFGDSDTESEWKHRFLKAAVKWSNSNGFTGGHPQLNKVLAKSLSKAGKFAEAQRYWLRSDAPTEHAVALVKWSKKGLRGERDLFIARAVLEYAALKNLAGANKCFSAYIRINGTMKDPLDTPLIHFVAFLLKTLERDALPLFQLLREKYAASLARDPGFEKYLSKIGSEYYNLAAPKGMLDGILDMLNG